MREKIISEVQSSDFLSIQADETMDVGTQTQFVLVLRYINGANLEHHDPGETECLSHALNGKKDCQRHN